MVSVTSIFYFIYFLYLISLFVDWELTLNNEYAIWGLTLLLLGLFFSVCIAGFFNMSGSPIINISGFYLTLILLGLLAVLGLVLYYQHHTVNRLMDNVKSKIARKEFIPLNYQYGRDSQEIGMRLQITDNEIISRNESRTLQEVWERLMARNTPQVTIKKILKQILSNDMNESIDVCYDLLWYLCISEDPFRNDLTRKETSYVMKCTTQELEDLLGNNYTGSRDRASLLFAIISGQVIPAINATRNYDEVLKYDPNIVYNLSFIHNKIIDHDQGIYNVHGPYTYLLTKAPSPIETIISNIEGDDYTQLLERLGIGPINNFDTMTNEEKLIFLQGELSLYHNVFHREAGIQTPPSLM